MRLELFDPSLLELVEEQRAYNAQVMEQTAAMKDIDRTTPAGITWLREAMAPGGLFGMKALDFPVDRTIDGPAGPMNIRILRPDTVRGVYLHFHGGAMTLGSAAGMDGRNWDFAQAMDVAVVSVDYRLAPEDPFPAGVDDCVAAALWLMEHAQEEFGTGRLVVGGESAGAYFALVTLLRLRDRLGGRPPFLAADLCYGGYDLSSTPSRVLQLGKVPYAFGDDPSAYAPDRTLEQLRDPALSPMWAELHDLPPAILTVGTADWLLDESLFMAARLAAAGNEVELAVYPEGPHGIEMSPTAMGRAARQAIFDFVGGKLAAAS